MGKSLDQLGLDDTPLRRPAAVDPRETDWYQFAREIDDVLLESGVAFAAQTLEDIRETVERTQRVTQGQRNAVHNIARAAEAKTRAPFGRASRRYEGFSRG